MIKKDKQKLIQAIKVMKILNKMQTQTIDLRKNINGVNEENDVKELEKKIFECSLTPVDIIGDTVYLDFLKKNKIKPMAEPNQFGWYHVQKPKMNNGMKK